MKYQPKQFGYELHIKDGLVESVKYVNDAAHIRYIESRAYNEGHSRLMPDHYLWCVVCNCFHDHLQAKSTACSEVNVLHSNFRDISDIDLTP